MNDDKEIGIVSIEKKGKQFIVSFTNDCELNITPDLMVEYRVSLDKRYTKEEFKILKKDVSLSKALDKSINHITYKLRTKHEMVEYLKLLKLNEEEINTILNKLKKLGFINDSLYVNSFKEECIHSYKGERYFKYQLKLKGIDEELINNTLYNEMELIDELIEKYQKEELRLVEYPKQKQREKLFVKLTSAGFSTSHINQILDNINYDESIDRKLEQDIEKIMKKTNDYNKRVTYLLSKGYNYSLIKEKLEERHENEI